MTSQSTREQIRTLEHELRQLKLSLVTSSSDPSEIALPLEALVVHCGGFVFAINVKQVQEISAMVLVTPLPGAPGPIRGSINYRGRLIPVLDLRHALTGAQGPLDPEMFLVVVSTDANLIALAVDRVEDVQSFSAKDVESASDIPFPPSIVPCLLRGHPGAIALLDPLALLTAGEINLLLELLEKLRGADEGSGC